MREREEGQKRCIISRAPPSPFAPVEWWGQPDPPKKSFVKLSPAEGKRARVSAEERQSGSNLEERHKSDSEEEGESQSPRWKRVFTSRTVMALQRWATLLLAGIYLRKPTGL